MNAGCEILGEVGREKDGWKLLGGGSVKARFDCARRCRRRRGDFTALGAVPPWLVWIGGGTAPALMMRGEGAISPMRLPHGLLLLLEEE